VLGDERYWQTRKMFDLAGWLKDALRSSSDQALLEHRLANKLSGARRGRLYLPSNFPPEVRALSNMTIGQLRQTVYHLRVEDSARYTTNRRVANFAHQVFPDGQLRTVHGNYAVHLAQKELAAPLPSSDWPRLGTRSAWPSSPTVYELLEMSRRGITPLPMQKPRVVSTRPTSRAQYNSDAVLRARVISNQIVGIRSDVKVPNKFIRYFRYRWNFLILAVPYNLPIGLVRFLTGQWIRNPHNLWLREKCSFKNFLKKTENTRYSCGTPGPW